MFYEDNSQKSPSKNITYAQAPEGVKISRALTLPRYPFSKSNDSGTASDLFILGTKPLNFRDTFKKPLSAYQAHLKLWTFV